MKRTLAFPILLIFISVGVNAQFAGSGTFASPYSGGTLVSNATWGSASSPIFVNGTLTIGTGASEGHLTIEPGVDVIFLSSGSNIIITGLGRLTANGSSTQKILFTADHDNDGSYGEPGETWGHISFQSMGAAGASILSHCIFEYGYSVGTGLAGYGGALHIAFTNVTVSDCIFRHNRADWGGALFVNQNFSPLIRNCYVHNNTSNRGGGGFYFWNGSASVIENCIFESNQVLEPSIPYYTGGGIAGQSNTSIKILNCTFVNNTSTRLEGQALLLHSSPNARVINSVFWGSEKQAYLYGTTGAVMINSASQGSITYTTGQPPINLLLLNASNNHVAGPNFTSPGASDWSLLFASPLRDAGVNSSPGVTIPFNDYLGNPLVYIKDIGAFEYQYSRWKTDAGSTDWNTGANWEGAVVPTSASDIVIPADATNYPTGSSAPSVSIGSGKYFIMEPGSRATVGNLTNGGTLQLKANASAFSSLILTSYSRTGSGTENIELYLSGGGTEQNDNYKWHYISSPVASLSTNIFTTITPDLAQFVESRPVFSLRQGWVAYDGYVYSTGLMNGPTFNSLTTTSNGRGYNYFDFSDHLYTFSGILNTSTVTAPLGFSGNASMHGFNLLGNPFISGLDWNYIVSDPGYPANTSKGLYFTRDNVQCSYIAGVGVPGDVNGIIPPMQGFFTKTYATGNSIILPQAARTHDNIHPRYKGGEQVIALVRLALQGEDITDETVLRFDHEAKAGWDNDFDAAKLFYSETRTYIYSLTDSIKYSINGQPFPDSIINIPLVLHLISDGTHTISATQLQGLENYKVRLVDQQTNTTRELSTTPVYSFTSPKGLITNRFVLKVSTLAYSSEIVPADNNLFNVYQSFGKIYIIPESNLWDGKTGSADIIDLNGRTIESASNILFSKGSIISVDTPKQKGIYFVNLKSGMLSHTTKMVIR